MDTFGCFRLIMLEKLAQLLLMLMTSLMEEKE